MNFERKTLHQVSLALLAVAMLNACSLEPELSVGASSDVGLMIAGGRGPAAGVQDRSWNTKREANVELEGRTGLNVTYERAWAGLSYGLDDAVPTEGAYAGVALTLKGAGQKLALYVESAEASFTKVNLEAGASLQTLYIPWDELGSPSTVERITLQEDEGGSQAAFFLDNLYLYRSGVAAPERNPAPVRNVASSESDPVPSADSRLIYVSSSTGDDETAEVYSPADAAVGGDYLRPESVNAFASIEEAYARVRDGYPDWLLFRKGDTWRLETPIQLKSGRTQGEPSVIASFGDDAARPRLETGAGSALSSAGPLKNVAVIGLEAYADARDPASPTFGRAAMDENPHGFRLVSADGEIENVRFLDNKLTFFGNNIIQASGRHPVTNIELRRNLVLDNYAAKGHSQGLFVKGVTGLRIEDNVFDHNGWRVQSAASGKDSSGGQATIFNHNLYLSDSSDVTLARNFIARASSMGVKFRSDAAGGSERITVSNNLFIEGEIGVGIGGNTDAPGRFSSVSLTDNVFYYVGRAQPTGRVLAWNIDVVGWDGGEVSRNLIAKQLNGDVKNVFGIRLDDSSGLEVTDNLFTELNTPESLVVTDDVNGEIRDNVQAEGYASLESYLGSDFATFIEQMRGGTMRADEVIDYLKR